MNRYNYTKQRELGRLKRMWETYEMWRMMRLLKEYQYDWMYSEFEPKKVETPAELEKRLTEQFIETTRRTTEPDILFIQLAVEYIKKYDSQNITFPVDLLNSENPYKRIAQAKSIIFNCKEKGFISYTGELNGKKEENPHHITITLCGKKFATFEGLLKEWITDDIGVLWSSVLAILGTLSLSNIQTLIKWSGLISPWW